MAERYLELHSEFRDRYILFHLADGTVKDSREINWRRVEWEKVVELEARLRGNVTRVTCRHPRFQFFLNFKIQRYLVDFDGTRHEERWWVIGWTDGETAYLTAIDFVLGKIIKEYQQPLHTLAGHIHPRVQDKRSAKFKGVRTQDELGY